jgi:hypothetical protein
LAIITSFLQFISNLYLSKAIERWDNADVHAIGATACELNHD